VVDGGEAGAEEVVVFGELAAFGFAEGFGGDAGEQELRGAEGALDGARWAFNNWVSWRLSAGAAAREALGGLGGAGVGLGRGGRARGRRSRRARARISRWRPRAIGCKAQDRRRGLEAVEGALRPREGRRRRSQGRCGVPGGDDGDEGVVQADGAAAEEREAAEGEHSDFAGLAVADDGDALEVVGGEALGEEDVEQAADEGVVEVEVDPG
jgi:hypothetical protein